ncbi:MAG: universal stress protein [Micavibrio aeruginosavorus]|nr:universal stress protein [Micavibrio aeruginosavorus]
MEPKTILVPFGGHDRELAALKFAFGLAETYKAHVAVWHVSPDPRASALLGASYGIQVYPEALFADIMKMNARNRKAAEEKYAKLAAALKSGAGKGQGASSSFHAVTGPIDEIIPVQARLADLIVTCRPGKGADISLPDSGAMLFASGRPLLFVPPGDKIKKFNGKTLIAWNGSAEAARAVQGAMPLLGHGKTWVLTSQKGDARNIPLSAEDLLPYLRRHGIKAEILPPMKKAGDLPKFVHDRAKTLGAGMIVMGGYGHTRLRETLLGGMTDYFLHHADIPVLMAH